MLLLLAWVLICGSWPNGALAELDPQPQPQPVQLEAQDQAEANRLLKERKWPEAVIVFRSLLRKGQGTLPVTLGLVQALAYSGRREEALGVLGQTLIHEKKPADIEILKRRVRVLSRMFLNNQVFQTYQDGLNLMASGKYRLARERFEKAIEQEPDNAEVLLRSGQCLYLEGDHDSASERLRLAKRLNPYEPEISLWLGRSLQDRGELKEALNELRMAYRGLPNSERAAIWYAQALASGQPSFALQVLEKDTHLNSFHLNALWELSRLKVDKGVGDSTALLSARKDLQVLLSRIGKSGSAESGAPPELVQSEGELGVEWVRTPEEMKENATKLIAALDDQIKKAKEASAED